MVKIDEPALGNKKSPVIKLPTIKMKKQIEKPVPTKRADQVSPYAENNR